MLGKIAPNIGNSNVKSSHATALAMCFDYHKCLLFNFG
jgi:hypothetical protein